MALLQKVDREKCLITQKQPEVFRFRFGWFGRYLGFVILYAFSLVLLPMYVFMLLFNRLYFWLYCEESIPSAHFYHFDRHNVKHLNFFDKLGCEYCEWANGTLQWIIEIANKVEKRFCPIKNNCDPNCEKVKGWRKEFLDFDHSSEELEKFYRATYASEQEISKP